MLPDLDSNPRHRDYDNYRQALKIMIMGSIVDIRGGGSRQNNGLHFIGSPLGLGKPVLGGKL